MKLTPEQIAIIERAGKSVEDFQRDLKNNPSPINLEVVNDLGNALVVTYQNDNELGNMVMSLFIQVNDLAEMVMLLQSELEALKNA
ncbi:hypothetical protein ACQCT5_10520 [Sutcliffiella halmapala]